MNTTGVSSTTTSIQLATSGFTGQAADLVISWTTAVERFSDSVRDEKKLASDTKEEIEDAVNRLKVTPIGITFRTFRMAIAANQTKTGTKRAAEYKAAFIFRQIF